MSWIPNSTELRACDPSSIVPMPSVFFASCLWALSRAYRYSPNDTSSQEHPIHTVENKRGLCRYRGVLDAIAGMSWLHLTCPPQLAAAWTVGVKQLAAAWTVGVEQLAAAWTVGVEQADDVQQGQRGRDECSGDAAWPGNAVRSGWGQASSCAWGACPAFIHSGSVPGEALLLTAYLHTGGGLTRSAKGKLPRQCRSSRREATFKLSPSKQLEDRGWCVQSAVSWWRRSRVSSPCRRVRSHNSDL